MAFTQDDILTHFGQANALHGMAYVQADRVRDVRREGNLLTGKILGNTNKLLAQRIEWTLTPAGIRFKSQCDCAAGANCAHVAAILLAYLKQSENDSGEKFPKALASWIQKLLALQQRSDAPIALPEAQEGGTRHSLLFVLFPDASGRKIMLTLARARLREDDSIVSAREIPDPVSLLNDGITLLSNAEQNLLRLYIALRAGSENSASLSAEIRGTLGALCLEMLAREQKILWVNDRRDLASALIYPLRHTGERSATLEWLEEDDKLSLSWVGSALRADGKPQPRHRIDHVLPTDPPWYFDNLTCGPLLIEDAPPQIAPVELIALAALAPAIALRDRHKISQHLLLQGLHTLIPLPEAIDHAIRSNITARPVLTLDCRQKIGSAQALDFATLSYEYEGMAVEFDPAAQLVRKTASGLEIITRHAESENAAKAQLQALGFTPAQAPLSAGKGQFQLPNQTAWLQFAREQISRLQAAHWKIVFTEKYRYQVVDLQGWYARVGHEHGTEHGWFDFELGILLGEEKISLLPILLQLIAHAPEEFEPAQLARHAPNDHMLTTLADGRRVALPWSRVRAILEVLGELYYDDQINRSVRLRTLDSTRLVLIEDALGLHTEAAEDLRTLGLRLLRRTQEVDTPLPVGLKATLREYQKEGLAWMQTLRAQNLGGILADDMGLGKTVQTLAHLLLEKESGRLDCPALIIAPTSLLSNWQDEAARFTPDLRVLCLHGKERLRHFEKIREYDLILTSYALLPRDYNKLREYTFHLLILDESHYIKNIRAKVTQSAAALSARHRLCLTGTPLENHLGELWSQFHFLLPGFLGDERRFNLEFRNPIEKHKDQARRALLGKRIQPFILRRTKDKVARELPAKTEIVRHIELQGGQRDLYEAMRTTMNLRVRNEIAEKGMARSQIIILDAMLKLRQVCCDPRLVKLPNAHEAASAKRDELLDMLDDLLEEGRKILVFSQFTSMLHLIEEEFEARKIRYALLTGETKDRAEQVALFQQGLVPVFLISLKAGGVGLNLTAADTVIHYDPWWNPAAENQATDRAWRIGQNKPVFVYKLIAKGTLEEKIQEMQLKKADLAKAILAGAETLHLHMTPQELEEIFAPIREEG